jgi:predicted aldo/keto reductase-like oxidoreductase
MMVAAAEGGVNYFDTAPGYFDGKSETVFGKGFAELRRRNLPYYAATKTFASTESGIRREIEAQLKRLDIPAIDFYHIWSITDLENWQKRKKDGVLTAFRKLKEEGLIRHICVSSHLARDEIKSLLMEGGESKQNSSEGIFEGVLFGYSFYNFRARQAAFDAIREKRLGAVVMNPLGGGLIPQHQERFKSLQRPGEGAVAAALHFLWDHPDINVTLVGFDTLEHVKEALAAVDSYVPRSQAELDAVMAEAPVSLEGLCTGCAYCVGSETDPVCPAGIPIPHFMETYNHKIFTGKDDFGRLSWHWGVDRSLAKKCTACGRCEKSCTQHINIIERLKEFA